jgi:ATP-dependent helicase/nuclease subunit B
VRVLLGLDLGGASATARNDLPLAQGRIGDVCWGPAQVLRDLELRLGLSAPTEAHALRVARFAARMAKLAAEGRYYSKSFRVDALGTAASVLKLRDLLIESGWKGDRISGGGARLEAIHELEQLSDPVLPTGDADRVAAVARELGRRSTRFYAELAFVEPNRSWSACWQRVFCELERGGTRLTMDDTALPDPPVDSDLGRLQHMLRSGPSKEALELRGDGSFAVITAETSWQAAQAVAAILASQTADKCIVIREHDASALDNALATAGVRTQGLRSVSPWRSALQVLPLALELAFEPKDPYRVLELLTLPVGPFTGFVGHALARALAQSPGIGSPAWEDVKQQLPSREPERAPELLARIAEWLEATGADASVGVPIGSLIGVVERVRRWVVSRIPAAPDERLLLAAAQQAAALRIALESDPRAGITLVQVRKLAESVLASGVSAELVRERAGRVAVVDAPGSLRAPRESVVWWSFTAPPSASGQLPWRRQEVTALAAAGLTFPDPARRLSEQAAALRVAFCCAAERLLLVVPHEQAGQALSSHPLWDELLAGARLDEIALSSVTVNARGLLDPARSRLLWDCPPLVRCEPVELPGGESEWRVPPDHVAPIDRFSPASLEALLGCPLEWALRYRAGARSGGHALPPLFLLNGSLGHRLVELLHGEGAFELEEVDLRQRAQARLKILFLREGAVLLRPGMGFERAQLELQLIGAVLELSRLLRGVGLRIVAVEQALETPWQGGKLEGRLDLLVAAEDGQHAIIDMKGGMSTYRDLLRDGRAVQLAAYAFAQAGKREAGAWPDAGYFSLKRGKLFGLASRTLPHAEVIAGPTLIETWQKVERSLGRLLPRAQQGRFAVTGVRGAPSLLEALGIPEAEASAHLALPSGARCQYCRYDALCGRRWEALQ